MSTKEIELIDFLNKKCDVLLGHLKDIEAACSNQKVDISNYQAYCNGYSLAIRDVKSLLLRILENKEVLCYEEKSS